MKLFLFGARTQKDCGGIFRERIPQIAVQNQRQDCGEFILLRRSDPVEYWCIFDSRQESVLRMAEYYHLRTLTCGFSPYDTLVLSAWNEQTATVSLLREIRSVSGGIVEPGDYLLHHDSSVVEETLLLCAGTLLLLGWQERGLFL